MTESSLPGAYQLLDFGWTHDASGFGPAPGRRLESWGPVRLVRPDPRAAGRPRLGPEAWDSADAEFHGRVAAGRWRVGRPFEQPWHVALEGLRFEVRCAPSMHTGLFPEQAAHWRWLRDHTGGRELDVLNLFAYTGGASLALARLGHRVTHVDASKPVVNWARRNAAINDLTSIRWIEEDARAFVRREGRRGRRYGGLLLDPPAFGRGGHGVWRIETDLDPMLDDALALLEPDAAFVLVNLYGLDDSPGDIAQRVSDRLDAARHPLSRESIDAGTLDLATPDGRTLPTGVYARVARAVVGLRSCVIGPPRRG